jgi:hypothetical protein
MVRGAAPREEPACRRPHEAEVAARTEWVCALEPVVAGEQQCRRRAAAIDGDELMKAVGSMSQSITRRYRGSIGLGLTLLIVTVTS